jgi:chromosome partitioning protein
LGELLDIRRRVMRTIASANQKGGCGKTTTAINLSYSLSLKGKRVLLIDFDPQAHATMGLNIQPSDLEKTMYDVMKPGQKKRLGIDEIMVPVKDNLDLAPSSVTLSAIEQELSGVDGREDMLMKAITALEKPYDYIVIDCPPSIGHLCFNALRACQEAIIPIDMSLFSLRGVAKLLEILILLKDKLGHDVRSRALITMYDSRTRYSRRVLEKVKEEFGENVFETVIRYNIRLRETVDYGLPVGDYDKHAIGHQDYENLAEEILRSETVGFNQGIDTLRMAQDIINKTEKYMNKAAKSPETEQSAFDMEGFPSYPFESSYSEMVQAIAASPGDYVQAEDIEVK